MNNKQVVKGRVIAGVVSLGSLIAASSAHAAFTMPTAATEVFADMDAAWTAIEGLIWPVLGAVTIGFFVIRMFKKGANKVG